MVMPRELSLNGRRHRWGNAPWADELVCSGRETIVLATPCTESRRFERLVGAPLL
jgi:hypothetical protein